MRKLTSLFVAASLALGAANIVHAAADSLTPPPAGAEKPMSHKPHRPDGLHQFKGLNLTDAQKQQMRDILKASRGEFKRPSADERRALHNIVAADSFDKAKAEAQVEKMSADGKARMLARLATENKLYNVLTADQKKEFNQNFEKHLTEKPRHEGKMPPAGE